MNKFNYNIDEEINIMEKYSLSPTELFVIKTILLLQEGYEENYLIRFLNIPEKDRGDFRDILVSLQNKGIILKSYTIPMKGREFDPEEIQINKAFFKTIYRSSFELGKELFETYPMFTTINGSTVSLRGISKKFNSLEDFYRFYAKTIKHNPELHNHIIELINWEKDNNIGFINMSLAAFVIENKWNELEALRDGKIANVNFNTIKSL
jgi:hypothetical protein